MKCLKIISLLVVSVICIFCSCSSTPDPLEEDAYYLGFEEGSKAGYEKGYEEGYFYGREDGWNAGWESCYNEEQDSFQRMISNLMYDHEYDIVKSLLEYDRKEVEEALEYEFGTSDIDSIIEYFYELSITEAGLCSVCGKTAYADDERFSPDGIIYTHDECLPNTPRSMPITNNE